MNVVHFVRDASENGAKMEKKYVKINSMVYDEPYDAEYEIVWYRKRKMAFIDGEF